jgi:hypothetical protein
MIMFEPRSFLLVLFAFVGNAQVMGMDLTLTFIAPLMIALQFRDPWMIRQKMLPFFLVILSLLSFAALRATFIGIPYFDAYYLWPLKAIILLLLVAFGREAVWPVANMLVLALFVVALVLVGTVEDGRLVSVFGPNMLYRIFGLLFVFALMQLFSRRVGTKLVFACFVGIGFYALILTGSIGALVVIAVAVAVFFFRMSKTFFFSLAAISAFFGLAVAHFSVSALPMGNVPSILERVLYKLRVQEASERTLSWIEITSRPFSTFGYNYSDFWMIWNFRHYYPHNIFLELYGFYGLIGIGLILVMFAALFKALPRIMRGDILAISLVIFMIGSFFSGDLSDNYGVVGLAGGLALRPPMNGSSDKPILNHREKMANDQQI